MGVDTSILVLLSEAVDKCRKMATFSSKRKIFFLISCASCFLTLQYWIIALLIALLIIFLRDRANGANPSLFFRVQSFGISKADYWALATIVAVDHGLELSNAGRGDGKR